MSSRSSTRTLNDSRAFTVEFEAMFVSTADSPKHSKGPRRVSPSEELLDDSTRATPLSMMNNSSPRSPSRTTTWPAGYSRTLSTSATLGYSSGRSRLKWETFATNSMPRIMSLDCRSLRARRSTSTQDWCLNFWARSKGVWPRTSTASSNARASSKPCMRSSSFKTTEACKQVVPDGTCAFTSPVRTANSRASQNSSAVSPRLRLVCAIHRLAPSMLRSAMTS
mmetsp:Transcript_5614/g.13866  ORF Transcript_5614/g.13866 Transcript_5614/m.13866 type:complete len:223 (-) Transcript_5614:125-793(-)